MMKLPFSRETLTTVAPYLVWMALMFALPASALSYAARTVASAVALAAWFVARARRCASGRSPDAEASALSSVAWGVGAGVLVTVLWIAPEYLDFYRDWCILGDVPSPLEPQTSDYAPENCGWPLTFLRLFGSAFVIAPAEELFFRHYLYRRLQHADWTEVRRERFDVSAFLWMVGLFALEHNRVVAAAVAGALYGFVYMRSGLFAAVLAHSLTNLLLALYVLETGAWSFW